MFYLCVCFLIHICLCVFYLCVCVCASVFVYISLGVLGSSIACIDSCQPHLLQLHTPIYQPSLQMEMHLRDLFILAHLYSNIPSTANGKASKKDCLSFIPHQYTSHCKWQCNDITKFIANVIKRGNELMK